MTAEKVISESSAQRTGRHRLTRLLAGLKGDVGELDPAKLRYARV
jgi:hypothetical protein